MRKYKAQLEYEKEVNWENERVKYEWWRFQRIPLHLGIVEKNKNIKREHSNHDLGRKALVFGDAYKPIVIYHKHKYTRLEDKRKDFKNALTDENVPHPDL